MDNVGGDYTGIVYENLRFNTKEINQNFKIKVSGVNNGCKVHKLVGVSGLIDIVGDSETVNNLLERVFSKGEDKVECRLRRGLKITFYAS